MALPKGRSNSGIKNLAPFSFPKGKSGYDFKERNVICITCNKEFTTRGTNTKYCSQSCKEKSRPDKQKTSFICEFCNKQFRRRAPDNAGRFCSRRCSGLWSTANGVMNYFYKAFLYLPHKCDVCGIEDFDVLLVHHKNKNRLDASIDNLQILCANCHYRIHFGNGATRYYKIKPILEYLERIKNESFT